MTQESKRLYPRISPSSFQRLSESAEQHDVLKEDDTPNVSRFVSDILLLFLRLERMEGMDALKASDGSNTMDIIRRATHQFVNGDPTDDTDDEPHEKRHLN